MKQLLKIMLMLVLLSGLSFAQSQSDSLKDNKSQEIEKKSDFIDENANGVDDRIEKQQGVGKQKRLRDRFVDLDGDGICDGRSGGVGIRSRHGVKQDQQGGKKRLGNR
ncbi:MAG: hypothetical protein IGBAC_0192 [Ignavibacteriae bacterium]|nr:MAG: hypothetical protein IGBAC_0192 [Ignavibacteriota bacterium]